MKNGNESFSAEISYDDDIPNPIAKSDESWLDESSSSEEIIEEKETNYFVEATPEISVNGDNGGPAFVEVEDKITDEVVQLKDTRDKNNERKHTKEEENKIEEEKEIADTERMIGIV